MRHSENWKIELFPKTRAIREFPESLAVSDGCLRSTRSFQNFRGTELFIFNCSIIVEEFAVKTSQLPLCLIAHISSACCLNIEGSQFRRFAATILLFDLDLVRF